MLEFVLGSLTGMLLVYLIVNIAIPRLYQEYSDDLDKYGGIISFDGSPSGIYYPENAPLWKQLL